MRRRKGRGRDEDVPVTVRFVDSGEGMCLKEFLMAMRGFAECGNLNLIAKEYVHFSSEREESPEIQQAFEASLGRALEVCMKDKRTSTVIEFLANPAIPARMKRGADRFMLALVKEYAQSEDACELVGLLERGVLSGDNRSRAQRAVSAIEEKCGEAFTASCGEGRRRAATPSLRAKRNGSSGLKVVTKFPKPRNPRADAPTGDLCTPSMPVLKK